MFPDPKIACSLPVSVTNWWVEYGGGPNSCGPPLHGLQRQHFEFGGAGGAWKGLGHDWGALDHDKIVGARNGAHDRTNGAKKKENICTSAPPHLNWE